MGDFFEEDVAPPDTWAVKDYAANYWGGSTPEEALLAAKERK